jgi:hypothetical protein
MDWLTVLAALAPLVVDAGKAAIGRFIGADFKPANVVDWLEMQRMDIEKFTAMNAAGGANPSYPWVEAIIRLQRPLVAAVALGVWSYTRVAGVPSEAVDSFAAAVGFYLFGDRTLFYARGKK